MLLFNLWTQTHVNVKQYNLAVCEKQKKIKPYIKYRIKIYKST